MKVTACLSVAVLVVVLSGADSKDSGSSSANRRVVRGFRLGAADRFSHGFGKRADTGLLDYLSEASPDFALPNEEFADLLRSSEKLSNVFVQNTVDRDGDGFITKDELLGYSK